MTKTVVEFRQGVTDIFPVIAAASVIGLLWGTLAASKGLSPLEIGLRRCRAIRRHRVVA
jgi:predicted branched-subunit amino acid permease